MKINQPMRARRWSGALAGIVIALLLVEALAACGSATLSSPTPTPTPKACGTVAMLITGRLIDQAAAEQVENCFWQAYQHCQAASMQVTTMGIDAGTIRIFTVESRGASCQVTDMVHTYVAPNHTGPVMIYPCSGVTQQAVGLLIAGCGNDGNVVVPAMGSQPFAD